MPGRFILQKKRTRDGVLLSGSHVCVRRAGCGGWVLLCNIWDGFPDVLAIIFNLRGEGDILQLLDKSTLG